MLTIRLKPQGRKHRRHYRIVVAQKHIHVSKKSIEDIGHYDPYTKKCVIKQDRLKHYLDFNIEVSDTVQALIKKYTAA